MSTIEYGSFVAEINNKIQFMQNSINLNNNSDISWVNHSVIIRTSSNIWRSLTTGVESIRQYLKLLIKNVAAIGNSLKWSKVVDDETIDYMSDASDALTIEQLSYDLGLIPGNSDSLALNSTANVLTNVNFDQNAWDEFNLNYQTLLSNAEIKTDELQDEDSTLTTDLNTNLSFPDYLPPEVQG